MHKQPLLLLEIKPSPRLKQAKVAVYLLAAIAAVSSALPALAQAGVVMALMGHLYWALTHPNAVVVKIKHSDAIGWEVAIAGDEFESVRILSSSVITTLLVVIHYQYKTGAGAFKNGMQTLPVLFDVLDEKDFRHLVVRLKTSL